MPYLGSSPASALLTASDITDGVISTAKLADSSVTSAKITDGTIASGDLASGVGGDDNTPAFFAYLSATQTLTNNAYNKVNCDAEMFDSGGLYDNSSNYRFTPTTAGKYYCFANVNITTSGQSTCSWMLNVIFKNGTSGTRFAGYMDNRATLGNGGGVGVGVIIDFNGSSDYIELYTYPGLSSGTPYAVSTATSRDVYFGAFKLGT